MASSPGPGGWGYGSDSQGYIDTVRVKATATTAGAIPPFPLTMSNKVVSFAKDGGTTGKYDIVFVNAQHGSAGFSGDILQATYSKNGACTVRKIAESNANGTCSVLVCDGDGDGVYLADGDIITLVFARQRLRSQ